MRSGLFLLSILILSSSAYAQHSLSHNNGDVIMDLTDFGAFMNFSHNSINSTFSYPASKPTAKTYLQPISELWAGNSENFVASSVDIDPNTGKLMLGEWKPTDVGAISYAENEAGRQVITAQYKASDGKNMDILVDQMSYSWTKPGGFVLVKLTITNLNPLGIKGLLLGILTNWDVDDMDRSGNLNLDMVDWDPDLNLSYFHDADSSDGTDHTYIGVILIEGKLNGHRVIPYSGGIYLDANRFKLMSGKRVERSVAPGNYVSLISIGPYDLETRAPKTVIFAFVAGGSLDELRSNAEMARRMTFIPEMVKAVGEKGYVELSWEPPIDPRVSGYRIYRKSEGDKDFTMISSGTISAARFKDYEVQKGETYTYVIRPVTMEGELKYTSDEVSVKVVPKPHPPSLLRAGLKQDGIELSWDPSESSNLLGYLILRNRTGDEPWTPIATVKADSTSFLDRNVFPGNDYFYAIAAVGEGGIRSNPTKPVEIYVPSLSSPPSPDIDEVFVAPNPCSLSTNDDVTFLNLPAEALIRIYAPSGQIIREIVHRGGTSREKWDLRSPGGGVVSPGVYIYTVKMYLEKGKAKSIAGKLAILP
ncbi:TPA: fibronectin type III domain-containing protein [Candidatus Poribacteria bacterium]|nr:fibronectin type III domain-containing protein [Candidatus Poribacteria bacterium]HEX30621.1 fibronectin type III domain-containing protein [Candidatus Poribacteria bacterium]